MSSIGSYLLLCFYLYESTTLFNEHQLSLASQYFHCLLINAPQFTVYLFHFILREIPENRYCVHFTDERTEAQRIKKFDQNHTAVNSRNWIGTSICVVLQISSFQYIMFSPLKTKSHNWYLLPSLIPLQHLCNKYIMLRDNSSWHFCTSLDYLSDVCLANSLGRYR